MSLRRILIGRRAELDTFDTALDATMGAYGGLLLVAGEAGIGKSRLLDAFAERATGAGARPAAGRGWDFGGAPSLWPWIQVLRALPDAPAELTGHLDEQTRFARFEAMTEFLAEAARARPLVLLLDDLHAFDLPSIAMLRFLVATRTAGRILCVAAYRDVGSGASPEVEAAIAQLARDASVMQLHGLDREELASLVAELRGAPSDDLVPAIAAATAGNPLFAGELIRMGIGEREIGRVGSGGLPLPRTVRDALAAHIASLSDAAQKLLGVAAVVGRAATPYFLQHVGGMSPADTRGALGELRASRLLVDDPTDSTRVTLSHTLVREAALAGIGGGERHDLHRRAGEALETLYAQDLDAHLAELARHFLVVAEVGEREKAIRYSSAAGDVAVRLCAHEDAVDHFTRARTVVEAGGGTGDERHEELSLKLAEALLGAGRSADAARLFAHLGERAHQSGRPRLLARAALGFSRTGEYLEHIPDKRRWLEEAARALPADDELRLRVLARLAVELQGDANARARRDALVEETLALARRQPDPALLAFAIDSALHARHGADSLEDRLRLGSELVAIGETIRRDDVRLDGMKWRLTASIERGEMAQALAESDEALRLAERRRAPGPLVNALSRAGMIAFATGRTADGELLARRAWDIESRASDPAIGDLLFDAMLALPRSATGRRREIEEALPRFLATAERLRRPFLVAWAAWMAAAVGEEAQARLLLRRIGALDRVPDDFARLGLWALCADVALAVGERAAAVHAAELLRPYVGRLITVGTVALLGPVEHYLGKIAARHGSAEEAGRWTAIAGEVAARTGVILWSPRELPRPTTAARVRSGRLAYGEGAWTIGLDGKDAHVKDARGLHHIARLVAEPGREIHALALDGAGELPASDAGPLLDAQAKAAYRRRLEQLRDIVDDAEERGDVDCAEEARSEIEALSRELAGALGLGGRDRKAGAAAERARMRVTTAIRRALETVARVHADAAAHLSRAIRTGTFVVYDPDPLAPIEWDVSVRR